MKPVVVAESRGSKPVEAVRFSPDGNLLVSSAADRLLVWQATDLSAPPTALDNTSATSRPGAPANTAFRSLAFRSTSNGAVLAAVSSSDDGSINLWDIVNGQARRREQPAFGHSSEVTGLDFVDGRTLASLGDDATLRLWDVTDPASTVPVGQPLRGYPFSASALAFNPIGGRLATTSATDLSGVPPVRENLILWQLQLDAWKQAACHRAGHNLSPGDWGQLLANLAYDPALCPTLPVIDEGNG
jgi:WD40 repeat protein